MNRKNFSAFSLASLAFLFMLFLGSCGNQPGNSSTDKTEVFEMNTPPDTEHTTQNSVDYAGTYKGITPCADCDGIETELTINMDSTFSHSAKYLGKGDGTPVVTTGKYNWIDGGTIQLEGFLDGPSKYKVGEGQMWQLDMEGQKIEGALADKYILKKI